jgi:hypothetical protein
MSGKIFNFLPDNGARNVGAGSHSWIAAGVKVPHTSVFYHDLFIKIDQMEGNLEPYCSNSENWAQTTVTYEFLI